MNNINNIVEINKINSQLERAIIQKKRLIRHIYREYEHYLNLVRNLLHISVEKGLNELCGDPSIKDVFLNANELNCFFEKNLSKLIYSKLPLITVEQLKINKNEKNITQDINCNGSKKSLKTNDQQIEKFKNEDRSQFGGPIQLQIIEDDFQLKETMQFQISKDSSYNSEYYQSEVYEKLVSLDLDKTEDMNYLSNNHIIENIGVEKEFISSLLELLEEVKVEKKGHFENHNINQTDISLKYQNLKNFD